MLTPSDVEQKTFSTALRGYDLDEVDDFLDEVVATLRQLNEQLEEARAAQTPAGETGEAIPEPAPVLEPAPTPEPVLEPIAETSKPEVDESAIGRALIAAQNAADKLLEDARSEADRIKELAQTEADSWTEEREAKRREAEAEIGRLTARVASVRSELAVLAGEVSTKLDEMDEVLDGVVETDTDTGFSVESDGGEEPGHEAVDAEGAGPDEIGTEADDQREREETSDQGGGGSDHLDEMLSGVVNDLRLSPGDNETGSADHQAGNEHEDFDEDE